MTDYEFLRMKAGEGLSEDQPDPGLKLSIVVGAVALLVLLAYL